jgi:CHAT domain-containing protein/Tfp pilus assembly protein PilF
MGPDGKQITEFDFETRLPAEEKAELVAEASDGYRLSVEARQQRAAAGGYAIRFVELRVATERDRSLQEARRLSAESVRLLRTGKYDEAITLGERALKIREKTLEPQHPEVATALNNLAEVYRPKGDYDRAERLYQRALENWEKSLGPEHPNVAAALNNLAIVQHERGDLVKAEQLYQRALKIWERSLGPDHLDVATSLNNLAVINHNRGDLAKAEQLYQRALGIKEKTLGPEHPSVASSLSNLAVVHHNRGDLVKAEQLSQRALEIKEKLLGPEHPSVAASLNNLAILHRNRGNWLKAEQLDQRALKIREERLGPQHPHVSESYNSLAILFAAKGDLNQAITTQRRANSITQRNLALYLVTGSERQKLAYLSSLSEISDRTLSLHIHGAPDNLQAQELAAITILQRKGRVLEAMADNLTALRQRLTAEDQTLLDQLRDATAQLASLVLNGPQRIPLDQHQRRIGVLEEQREKLESKISLRSAGFYERPAPVTFGAIQAAIPVNAALIEFSTYRQFDPKALEGKGYGEPRYVAYILRHQGEIRWAELGKVKVIDEAIAALRGALRDPKRGDVRELARTLDEKVMQPIRKQIEDASQLLISPDGMLNLLPVAALVDEQGRYLVERYSISYLTSGRDLLRLQMPRQGRSTPLVVADPIFGEPEGVQVSKAAVPAKRSLTRNRLRQSVTTGGNLSEVYFARLEGTQQEARAIQSLFPDSDVLTGAHAAESALKQAVAPQLVHIATHGFFLEEHSPAQPQEGNRRGINLNVRIENPLLRSGLALTGANLRSDKGDDGILTAMEATGLNLWGTKLVTLSACDTGLGEVKNGEGVYGLRRAFVLAGAETLVMSLWPVSDRVTRELMTRYYEGLKRGQGRGEALRQMQLDMLKRKERQHPFYWASFIQSGEWANLDGKR